MNAVRFRPIPEASLRRLPSYYRVLQKLQTGGAVFVSCSVIAKELNLDPTQVRKDIESTGIIGKPKVGYGLAELMRGIAEFLGWNNTKDAFLAGAGSLGSALLGYQKFRQYGLTIVAAFETDPAKVGTSIHGVDVLPLEKMADLAQRMHVHMGIITVPASEAQAVADQMVQGGILAIWNFAPVWLRVPETVIVQNEDLYPSLALLSYKLVQRLAEVASEKHASDHGSAAGGGTEV